MATTRYVTTARLRADLAGFLELANHGDTIVVKHYNRPIATIVGYKPSHANDKAT